MSYLRIESYSHTRSFIAAYGDLSSCRRPPSRLQGNIGSSSNEESLSFADARRNRSEMCVDSPMKFPSSTFHQGRAWSHLENRSAGKASCARSCRFRRRFAPWLQSGRAGPPAIRPQANHVGHPAAESQYGARVELRNARFVDAEPGADLLHSQRAFVVKRDDGALAFVQAAERARKQVSLFAAVTPLIGTVILRGRQVVFIHTLAAVRQKARPRPFKSEPLQLGRPLVPAIEPYSHRPGHLCRFRRAPQAPFKSLTGGFHFLDTTPHVPRSVVLVAKRIEHGATNAITSIALDGSSLGRIKFADSVDQAHRPVAHQVVKLHVRGQAAAQLEGNPLDQRCELHDQVVGATPSVGRPALLCRARIARGTHSAVARFASGTTPAALLPVGVMFIRISRYARLNRQFNTSSEFVSVADGARLPRDWKQLQASGNLPPPRTTTC